MQSIRSVSFISSLGLFYGFHSYNITYDTIMKIKFVPGTQESINCATNSRVNWLVTNYFCIIVIIAHNTSLFRFQHAYKIIYQIVYSIMGGIKTALQTKASPKLFRNTATPFLLCQMVFGFNRLLPK